VRERMNESEEGVFSSSLAQLLARQGYFAG